MVELVMFAQLIWNPQRLMIEQHVFTYRVCEEARAHHTSVYDPVVHMCYDIPNSIMRVLPVEEHLCDSVDAEGMCNAPKLEDREGTW